MAIQEHGLFRLVDHPGPDVAQGGCYYSHATGPGVDTGILIEFEGTLFLSLNTIRELAEVAGFRLNEEGIKLEEEIAVLQRANAEQASELEDARAQLDAVGIAVAQAYQRSQT